MNTIDLTPTSIVKAKLAAVPGILLALCAGVHPLLVGLFTFQVLDFLTGIMASLGAGHKLSSAVATAGVKKKVMMWVYVLMAHLLASYSPKPIGIEAAGVVAGLWIGVEAISICENGAKLGLPPPRPVRWMIEKFQAIYEQSTGPMAGTTPAPPQEKQ